MGHISAILKTKQNHMQWLPTGGNGQKQTKIKDFGNCCFFGGEGFGNWKGRKLKHLLVDSDNQGTTNACFQSVLTKLAKAAAEKHLGKFH